MIFENAGVDVKTAVNILNIARDAIETENLNTTKTLQVPQSKLIT